MRFSMELVIVLLCLFCAHVKGDGDDGDSSSTTVDTTTKESTTPSSTAFSSETTDTETSDTETSGTETSETSKVTHDTIITMEPSTEGQKKTTNDIDSTTESDSKVFVSTTSIMPPKTTTAPKPSACSKSPCKNKGVCHEDEEDPIVYSCVCPEGFTGTRCQVTDKCVSDDDNGVCNEGACVYDSDGLSRGCECFYGTFWDGEKKQCTEITPPCVPCQNGGTCDADGDDFKCLCPEGYEGTLCDIKNECGKDDDCGNGKCVTKDDSKYCECNRNHFWNPESKSCEAEEPPCKPNPCENSGVCESHSSKDFNCTCPFNFYGEKCEKPDFCSVTSDSSTKECENGICGEDRRCKCNKGYLLDEDSHTCEAIVPPCQPNPCKNNGICFPVDKEKFNCTCSDGFMGPTCMDSDFCVLQGGNAFCGEAECTNDPKSSTFFCSCDSGQFFDYIFRTCQKIDFCPLMKCKENEDCKNSKCDCIENAEWSNSTGKCEVSLCSPNPCPLEDLVCLEGNGIVGYQCACKKGHYFDGEKCVAGSTCSFPDLNSCEQECIEKDDGYECGCMQEDFVLNDDNKTCTYTGNSTCTNITCSIGACLGGETEQCICPPGFFNKEGQCKDLCSAGKLSEGLCPDNKCESTSSGFRCKCDGKYKLSPDKSTCTVRKMCEAMEAGWKDCLSRNAVCNEDWFSTTGYSCECAAGFVKIKDGVCRDVCSIEENQKICSTFGAKCDVDDHGNRTCKCPPYFQPFVDGKMCNKQALHSYVMTFPLTPTVYQKMSDSVYLQRLAVVEYSVDHLRVKRDVQEALSILFPGVLHINFLSYVRDRNFLLYKIEVQFSSITDRELKRLSSPEFCKAAPESTESCLVSPSLVLQKNYIKDFVSIQKTDPCDEDIKDALCEIETSCSSSPDDISFNCSCKSGFGVRNKVYPFGTTKSSIESCRDIDECSLGNPCPQNMKCENTFGSYKCSCKSGYRVDKDSSSPKCVKICDPNPCVHGECFEVEDNDFQCRCDAGYRGSSCDMQDENFKRARTNTIIVGAVLGGALLVTLIISYSLISRLKRKKSIDDPDPLVYNTEMVERRNDSGAINNAYQ